MDPFSSLWMFLIRKDGRINWLRGVGGVLFLAALANLPFAIAMDASKERKMEECRRSWEILDTKDQARIPDGFILKYPQRPDAFRTEYERNINYRYLWSGLMGLFGAVVFAVGYFLDGAIRDPLDPG